MTDTYLSVKEFASKLNVHPNTIRRAIKNRKINVIRLGNGSTGIIRINEMELLRMSEVNLDDIIEKEVQKRIENRHKTG